MKSAEFDRGGRGAAYRRAMIDYPGVRRREVEQTVELARVGSARRILDFGAGNAHLSLRLLHQLGNGGRLIASDNSLTMAAFLSCDRIPPGLSPLLCSSGEIPLAAGSLDRIVSLANFHHVDDKVAAMCEFHRLLSVGGLLVVADVCDGTAVQRYFDGPVNRICSTGHCHTFYDRKSFARDAEISGLMVRSWELRAVPWHFSCEAEAGRFLRLIHDARCSEEECLDLAEGYLGFAAAADNEGIDLAWELFFAVVEKAGSG